MTDPVDFGAFSADLADPPDFGADFEAKTAESASGREAERGVRPCGAGIGISIVENTFPRISPVLCHDILSAEINRQRNDAPILVWGGRLPPR